MAVRYPVIINGVRFRVNPTSLKINKTLNYGTVTTQGGVQYQMWFANPEVLTISGISAGTTAYAELLFLKQNFEVTNKPGKLSQLFYKSQMYTGFITNISVDHTIAQGQHLKFQYQINFQLVYGQQFKVEDFALQATGTIAETTSGITEIVNTPIAGVEASITKLIS